MIAEYGIVFLIGCSSQFLVALIYRNPILTLQIDKNATKKLAATIN